jgi:hypothetical protein
VVVVDDSDAGAPPLATARVRLSGGSGFARAANAGLAWAESEGYAWALVLNDDARPEPGCVEALLAAAGPGVGAVGPVLLGPEGVESAGIRFSERTARLKQVTDGSGGAAARWTRSAGPACSSPATAALTRPSGTAWRTWPCVRLIRS